MNSVHLNEHDANQGAQSSGEFLGMTGNSGWYLLGSGGATILMVIVLWGVLGVSLLLCLFVGIVLCVGAVAYVFSLKNNKPQHFDTDFFESALAEAGVITFRFGPRERRPSNPFVDVADSEETLVVSEPSQRSDRDTSRGRTRAESKQRVQVLETDNANRTEKPASSREKNKTEPVVAHAEYQRLREQLSATEDLLEDALAESSED